MYRRAVCIGARTVVGEGRAVARAVLLAEVGHHPVDDLRLARQPEAAQEQPAIYSYGPI